METLARLGVATVELLEAEGRTLRRHLIRLAVAAGCAVLLLILALAGVGFLVYGFYLLLAGFMGPSSAALVTGGSVIIIAVVGINAIKRGLQKGGRDFAAGGK